MDIAADGSRPILRINVIARSLIEPTYSFNDNNLVENENLGDQPNESFCDQSSDNLGDDSMNVHDYSFDTEDKTIDAEDFEHFEEDQGEPKLRSQPNHSFSDGTNFYMYQTFSTKSELQLLLAEVATIKSFDFATVKSCSKYLKVKCASHICAWMLQAKKYECSDRFRTYKYIDDHSCGVEYAINSHRKLLTKVIASHCVNLYRDGKGPNVEEIQRTIFNIFHCSPSYWKCWKGYVTAKDMVRGTSEHKYSCLPAFSYMFDTFNIGSSYCIMGIFPHEKGNCGRRHSFTCCLLCRGQRERCIFEKLKDTVVDESNLCFIYDRHKSSANDIAKVYNHAHHRYFMRYLGENLRVNHQCRDSLYLYYNAAKAYSLEKFHDHFLEFKDKSPEAAFVLEHDVGFEKWSRAYSPGNRYDVMTTNIAESLNAMLIDEREYPETFIFNSIVKRFGELFREMHAHVLKSKGNKMMPTAERIARKKMIEGDSLYVENITGDDNQFTVFGVGSTSSVNLLEKLCSCREYDLVKIPCAHAIAALRSKHGDEYGMNIYEYSPPLYKPETYLLAYSESINVVPIESEWCMPEELLSVNILPPLVDTKLGREKRERVKGVSENFKSKRRNKCSICKRSGHKKTTCMNNNKS
ncbi:uncharacterized protein LOC125839022 [Solanum verrucosum]|uniref:uncharacterized protein LOC125839022 n=1 Tax=Solanum verrucosum TaxID=315347 RepID=UPI0020D0A292|nr:uncharacterized protein LOC125839022 [Solanum verrucosum]